MLAAIDAGSNTLRLLIGKVSGGRIAPELYLRRITRLAGGFSDAEGLSLAARERTLLAFEAFAETCRKFGVQQVRAVGTAAFRQAINGEAFVNQIRETTGLPLEIVSGEMEAEHMVKGVLSALDPTPAQALIVDIGGGSTEFVLCQHQKVIWSRSLVLGVVRLTEGHDSAAKRQSAIDASLTALVLELADACRSAGIDSAGLVIVGTAGTITTLAALDMQMSDYDWRRVNNYALPLSRLQYWQARLDPLSPAEREALPGVEAGRGDLLTAGLEIILCLLRQVRADSLTVCDFGILEGLLLTMQRPD